MRVVFFIVFVNSLCLSGCAYDALVDPADLTVYSITEVDRSAIYDGDCDQEDAHALYLCRLSAMGSFIYGKIKYPAEARENGIEGRVIVRFVVEKDGTISEVDIIQDIGYGCGEEVVRVVRMQPPWLPAIKDGLYVRMEFFLPVTFRL